MFHLHAQGSAPEFSFATTEICEIAITNCDSLQFAAVPKMIRQNTLTQAANLTSGLFLNMPAFFNMDRQKVIASAKLKVLACVM